MESSAEKKMLERLLRDGTVSSPQARVVPLLGGVSSEIYLVEDGPRKWVVKCALEKLNVQDDWFADISRNRYEREFMKYVGSFLPQAVPRVQFEGDGYFVMEYVGEGFANWKQLMLAGVCELDHARRAGETLGVIHRTSAGDETARQLFDSTSNFHQLRSHPYLVTTGSRHPDLNEQFEKEVRRLESTRQCLVHGDYSPKNILVSETRLVVLDCEVAWYGDPAFDLAFLLTHLHLKAVHRPSAAGALAEMSHQAVAAYLAARNLAGDANEEMIRRTCRLLLMLLLARIDGKSPVEYLTDSTSKQFVHRFTRQALTENGRTLAEVSTAWYRQAAEL